MKLLSLNLEATSSNDIESCILKSPFNRHFLLDWFIENTESSASSDSDQSLNDSILYKWVTSDKQTTESSVDEPNQKQQQEKSIMKNTTTSTRQWRDKSIRAKIDKLKNFNNNLKFDTKFKARGKRATCKRSENKVDLLKEFLAKNRKS